MTRVVWRSNRVWYTLPRFDQRAVYQRYSSPRQQKHNNRDSTGVCGSLLASEEEGSQRYEILGKGSAFAPWFPKTSYVSCSLFAFITKASSF